MIKIGITSCFLYPDPKRTVFGPKTLSYLENDMAKYVTQEGVLPILIPDVEEKYLQPILAEMDGFVLQGGSDLAPESYGKEPIGRWKGDAYRDAYELRIMDYAIKNSKPILGICRGMQLMNVYFGGTLYQDIGTENPELDDHRSAQLYDTIKHPIEFVEGTILATLYANEQNPYINTVHHQAIKDLGANLEVYAYSNDGLIEAIGYAKEPTGKVMGVQWHPEFTPTLGKELIDENKLFQVFLEHTKS